MAQSSPQGFHLHFKFQASQHGWRRFQCTKPWSILRNLSGTGVIASAFRANDSRVHPCKSRPEHQKQGHATRARQLTPWRQLKGPGIASFWCCIIDVARRRFSWTSPLMGSPPIPLTAGILYVVYVLCMYHASSTVTNFAGFASSKCPLYGRCVFGIHLVQLESTCICGIVCVDDLSL